MRHLFNTTLPEVKLLKQLYRNHGREFRKSIFLQLLTGGTEGISVALLLPIIALLNTQSNSVDLDSSNFSIPLIGELSFSVNLTLILFLFLIIVILRTFLVHISSIASNQLVQNYTATIRMSVFEAIAQTHWSYLAKLRNADIYHKLTADIDRIQASVSLLMELIKSSILITIYLCLSLFISWKITIFAIIAGSLLLLALHPLRKRARQHGEEFTSIRQDQSRIISDFLDSTKVAKAFSAELAFIESLSRSMTTMRQAILEFVSLSSRVNMIIQISSAIVLVLIVFSAIVIFSLDVSALFGILVLYFRFSPRVLLFQSHLQTLKSQITTLDNVFPLLEEAQNNRENFPENRMGDVTLTKSIGLRNINFSYHDQKQALCDITLDIPAYKITAISGPTGSGKSTLIDLLMGMGTPDDGNISIDGLPLTASEHWAWRQQLGYAPQDPVLLYGTIRENLLIAKPASTDKEILEALSHACADQFISELPDGLDTMVGQRGYFLSGGERQRIALARALLRKPQALVLDEATSALDQATEQRILNSLISLRTDMTIIAITHSQAVLNIADRVIELNDGRIQFVNHH